MKFIITIDTEGDNQWDHGRALTVENIRYVPRFQELCEKFQIQPTYLVTTEVCEDPFAKEIFSDYARKGRAEIGAHLHSWSTPPFLDKDGFRFNDPSHTFATELPHDLLEEKIKNLTRQIRESFGIQPLSFRSGRYGFNEQVGKVLSDYGYLVDSSVTPYTSWVSNKGAPGGSGGP
ncbi:MAG: deacetylase, partial [Bacteroidota bacterium]|nr:deacetylase [Bacteroidota bacterium]